MRQSGDIADRAAYHEQQNLSAALANHAYRNTKPSKSAHECITCNKPIPELRRQAVIGVQRCVHCQTKKERGIL